jgi:hypothetical protein
LIKSRTTAVCGVFPTESVSSFEFRLFPRSGLAGVQRLCVVSTCKQQRVTRYVQSHHTQHIVLEFFLNQIKIFFFQFVPNRRGGGGRGPQHSRAAAPRTTKLKLQNLASWRPLPRFWRLTLFLIRSRFHPRSDKMCVDCPIGLSPTTQPNALIGSTYHEPHTPISFQCSDATTKRSRNTHHVSLAVF